MDPTQLAQLVQSLRGNAMAGAQGAFTPQPSMGQPPMMPPGGYMRPGAPTGPLGGASPLGLLSDPVTAGAASAAPAGMPAGFPGPMAALGSQMPMDRLRAMGQFGGMSLGSRVNTALPALPSWLTMGQSPDAQMAQILNIGKGPMLGPQPRQSAGPSAAAASPLPATIEDALQQYHRGWTGANWSGGGNSRNQGSAGDPAGHFGASPWGGVRNFNPGAGAGGM